MFEASLRGGMVLVWTGDDDPRPLEPVTRAGEAGRAFSARIEVRSPYERVAEAVLHNPGRALGLGPLFGAGDELAGPEVADDGETLTVRRERFRLDLPRIRSYDSPLKSVVLTEVCMNAVTGLARIDAAGARAIVGLTPIGPFRTILRWHGEAAGAGTAIGRLLSTGGARTGRTIAAAERHADDVEGLPDAGVERLRDLRAGFAERVLTRDPQEQS
jgi:hypothetical protein